MEGHQLTYTHFRILYTFWGDSGICSTLKGCSLPYRILRFRFSFPYFSNSDLLILLFPGLIEEWMANNPSWRNFILESYHNRLNELLETLDSIAFLNMDERLLKYLKNKSRVTGSTTINSTHQEIAYELHTSRVVISRLLKKLENMGKVKLNRYHIKLIEL
ncbi:hypothetical protein ZONE111904_11125 [Zobellia nedashkovskayae]